MKYNTAEHLFIDFLVKKNMINSNVTQVQTNRSIDNDFQ